MSDGVNCVSVSGLTPGATYLCPFGARQTSLIVWHVCRFTTAVRLSLECATLCVALSDGVNRKVPPMYGCTQCKAAHRARRCVMLHAVLRKIGFADRKAEDTKSTTAARLSLECAAVSAALLLSNPKWRTERADWPCCTQCSARSADADQPELTNPLSFRHLGGLPPGYTVGLDRGTHPRAGEYP